MSALQVTNDRSEGLAKFALRLYASDYIKIIYQ